MTRLVTCKRAAIERPSLVEQQEGLLRKATMITELYDAVTGLLPLAKQELTTIDDERALSGLAGEACRKLHYFKKSLGADSHVLPLVCTHAMYMDMS